MPICICIQQVLPGRCVDFSKKEERAQNTVSHTGINPKRSLGIIGKILASPLSPLLAPSDLIKIKTRCDERLIGTKHDTRQVVASVDRLDFK
ncbi:MAG: hypothetical protein DLM68_12790 [Hyphomicrobiales bacterium]|nr:MAG: hypothetical protein DLM68_12790 [Hyphomicrobiales bacterium]